MLRAYIDTCKRVATSQRVSDVTYTCIGSGSGRLIAAAALEFADHPSNLHDQMLLCMLHDGRDTPGTLLPQVKEAEQGLGRRDICQSADRSPQARRCARACCDACCRKARSNGARQDRRSVLQHVRPRRPGWCSRMDS